MAELSNGGQFPATLLVYIFQKEKKNEFENFLEKSSYTRILCPKELIFFLMSLFQKDYLGDDVK